MSQLELAKIHILAQILANTDSSVLLKLTESYKTMMDSTPCPYEGIYNTAAAEVCGKGGECGGNMDCCETPEKCDPKTAGDWEGQQEDHDRLEKTEPAPFTSEPRKRKPRASKAAPTTETAETTEAELPLEPPAPTTNYAADLEEAKALFISKIQAANAQSDEIGKVTRAKCVELCGEYGATRVSEIPAAQLREFIAILEKGI